MSEKPNVRNTKFISLYPMTTEEALRKALKSPPPKVEDRKPAPKPRKKRRAKGGQ